MTRETKIGLLVGLAFIIVIGILLSDHLTSTTEPPQAPLAQAGGDVRRAVTVPGGAGAPVTQVQTPQQVAPQQPVPTTNELTPRQPPVTVVSVGLAPGATNAQQNAAQQQAPNAPNTQVAQTQQRVPDSGASTDPASN